MLWDPRKDKQVTIEPWRQALLDAADLLAIHGWCQHKTEDKAGRMCAWGAMRRSTKAPDVRLTAFRHLSVYLQCNTWRWNDQCGRTREQVLKELRDCAARFQPH